MSSLDRPPPAAATSNEGCRRVAKRPPGPPATLDDQDDLVALFSRLWHIAEDGSWLSLRERGLSSTLALLDLCGVWGVGRDAILSARRPSSVRLARDGLPDDREQEDARVSRRGLWSGSFHAPWD